VAKADVVPIRRPAQIILEMEPGVPRGLLEQRREMLVITMRAVMSQPSSPALTEFAGQFLGHGKEDLKIPYYAWA
jgi:hypothetical protein